MTMRTCTTTCRWIVAYLALAVSIPNTTAFLFNDAQVHPVLESISYVTPGTATFRTRLDFNYNDARGKSHQLAINGPVIRLENDPKKSSVPLPSADGGHPNLSTGSKSVQVLQEAFFVGMQGMQEVPFEKGCWELAWLNEQREGQLVCGFNVPMPIRRGSAEITNGNTYFSFRVYTPESLAADQERKREVTELNAEAMQEKEEHLEKMHATNNVIMKAFHYRNAFAAFEKVLYAPQVSAIPDTADLIELPNGLLIVQEGSLYRKGNVLIGPSWHKIGKVTLTQQMMDSLDTSKLMP